MKPSEYDLRDLFCRNPILAVTLPSSLCTNWCDITPRTAVHTGAAHTAYTITHTAHIVPRWLGPFALTVMFLLADKFGGTRKAVLASLGSCTRAAGELQKKVWPQCPTPHAPHHPCQTIPVTLTCGTCLATKQLMETFQNKVSGYPHHLCATRQDGKPSALPHKIMSAFEKLFEKSKQTASNHPPSSLRPRPIALLSRAQSPSRPTSTNTSRASALTS